MKMSAASVNTLFFAILICLLSSVPATEALGAGEIIWEADKNVFFEYADQDKSKLGKNEHPVELAVDEVRQALGSINILTKGRDAQDNGPESAFTGRQVDLLSQYLVAGLANANPDQDVIFALDRSVRRLFGSKPTQLFVAGRAFHKDGKLNILIGDYDRAGDEAFASAYDPTHVGIVRYQFNHGRRSKSSKGFGKTVVSAHGVENKQLGGTLRKDWFVIDLNLASQAADLTATEIRTEGRNRKRAETGKPLASREASPDPPAAVVPAAAPGSAEQRLSTLNRLRDKGLITDEEYSEKRKQILDEL